MHRAFVGDLHQFLALLGVQWPFHGNDPIDLVEHAGLGFAFGAVFRVDLAVPQRYRGTFQRQRLAIGVKPHGHRGAGAEASENEVIGGKAGVVATCGGGLVGEQLMRPD